MAIAKMLKKFLQERAVAFDTVPHPRTQSSMKTAEAAHVPGDRLAKAVILEDSQGYLMMVVPSTHHLDLGAIHQLLGRRLGLATESELAKLFPDTDLGAIPPVGEPYQLEVALDESLVDQSEVYFEAGDHAEIIRVSGEEFQKLLGQARRGCFSHHV
jgi:Ala-tRNA(Pro) deacylase